MTPKFRALCLVPVFVAALFLSGCSKFSCPTTHLGSSGSGSGKGGINAGGSLCGSGGGISGSEAALVYFQNFDNTGASVIDGAVLTTSGQFTQLTATPVTTTGQHTDDMTIVGGKFLYVPFSDTNTNTVEAFSIDHTTGALTPIAGSPFALPAGTADTAVADPQGRFLFVGSEGSGLISVFQIDATTGALTLNLASPFTSFNLFFADSVTVDGTGNFLYVGQLDPTIPLDAFSIDQNNGALSEIGAFDLGVAQLHADPSGKFLLGVAEIQDAFPSATDQHIYVFAIDSLTGAPSPVAGSPFATTSAPFDFAISPNGEFVYVVGNDTSGSIAAVEGYQLDTTTGALTALPGSPFTTLPTDLVQCKFEQGGGEMVCTSESWNNFSVLTTNPSTGAVTNTVPDLSVPLSFPFTVTD
ncbi:MAG TPA: beta-propeller fold lactonase family protein [Terriglobales bacterium]|jgi:6-phosphogluconolactonase (cycloisomerase 2 family)|nr:beta-propeller fold lactonase family protein [Terriglobales bacterium]